MRPLFGGSKGDRSRQDPLYLLSTRISDDGVFHQIKIISEHICYKLLIIYDTIYESVKKKFVYR